MPLQDTDPTPSFGGFGVKGCLDELAWLKGHSGGNYQRFSQGQKQRLAALINHIRALSELLNKEVAL